MKNKIPNILLIGVGRFGEKHLETIQNLEKKGLVSLAGAVVRSKENQEKISSKYKIKVWNEITDDLLRQVDAVDIVTPPETHLEIALRCLPFTNILIEKPLATNTKDAIKINLVAKKYKRIVMVGHIYRFNPAVEYLREILAPIKKDHCSITGTLVNPIDSDNGRNIPLELLHLFDIVDYIFNLSPKIIYSNNKNRINNINLKYPQGKHAAFKIGWEGNEKIRNINFLFSKKEIKCDLFKNTIHINDLENGTDEEINFSDKVQPLEKEISTFIEVIKGKKIEYPDISTGIRMVDTATKIENQNPKKASSKKIKVAIIGGGIFGTNCAIELGKFADVTVFEKNKDIMLEASFVNQYRHHWGYHYPRSDKTVQDIRKAINDFESLYNSSIVRKFPTYYSIAKQGSKTTKEDYLKFCRKHKLPFTIEYPSPDFLNRDKVSLSLKTFEPIYDYDLLKKIVKTNLKKNKNISVKLSTEIVGGKIEKDGKKSLVISKSKNNKRTEVFDYVINTTYAQYNKFTKWFEFPIKPVRIDLVEALIVKLPLPKISLAVMDGPYTNLVPTSRDSLFTLVHIKESILERYVPKSGLPSIGKINKTRIKETLEKSKEWFPILDKAKVVEVRYVHRAVNANREHDDARPSDVASHGFGCWSILGGKIVNSVTTAKEIALEIKSYLA